eukprot:TRINITY_DN1009_c0_g1_i3.p1 TRINITY_DN1009_c0_g1~~TRINITY_DN1009_c0_g1_i3.p1  ORF type:complete len:110 (+),score=6.08 TRINITY_DN1009_c0_g1_i3:475-804(+)
MQSIRIQSSTHLPQRLGESGQTVKMFVATTAAGAAGFGSRRYPGWIDDHQQTKTAFRRYLEAGAAYGADRGNARCKSWMSRHVQPSFIDLSNNQGKSNIGGLVLIAGWY